MFKKLSNDKPNHNQENIFTLGALDHFSLEYYLCQKERIFQLIITGFNLYNLKSQKFINDIIEFSQRFLDTKRTYANEKEEMTRIIDFCKVLNIYTIKDLHLFLMKFKNKIREIFDCLYNTGLRYTLLPNLSKLSLYLLAFIPIEDSHIALTMIQDIKEKNYYKDYIIRCKSLFKLYLT